MYRAITIPITTCIYGHNSGRETLMVQLPCAALSARDLIAAHVSAELEQTLICQAVGANSPISGSCVDETDLDEATKRAWAALIERRTLLVVDGATVTDLDTPLNLSGRSQISLVQVLPLLIGG